MGTINKRDENLEDWKAWFKLELLKYQRWVVYLALLIVCNIGAILYIVFGMKNKFGWILILPLLILAVNEVAYVVRKDDVDKLLKESINLTETKTIEVTNLNGKEINKDYCYNYMKACGEKVEVGDRYEITYLKKTMGKYIINWVNLSNQTIKVKEENAIEEKIEITKKEQINTNKELEDTQEELKKRGIDIEEIKQELYNRNNSLDTEINIDIDKILNRGTKKDVGEN